MKMNVKYYLCLMLILSSCAAPTASIITKSTEQPLKLFKTKIDILEVNQFNNKFVLPINGISLPKAKNLLPNAERKYRNGIHSGFDFIANYGTPVLASFDGIITYANPSYVDLDTKSYEHFLSVTKVLKKTPNDIYNHILLGKHIVIDHGFSVSKDYRVTTIYAHLSEIEKNFLLENRVVKKGDVIGYVGNSGTRFGSAGNKRGAHLHWELHFENKNGKYYLGENISQQELIKVSQIIFER